MIPVPDYVELAAHPERAQLRAFADLLYARSSASVAAAFVIDMIEDGKEGLLRR